MKKITLLTVTMLTAMSLGAPSLAAQAAPYNKIIISYGGNCNIQDFFEKFENCFPEIDIPENNNPGNNNSGNESTTPEETPNETPDNDSSNDNNASDDNSNNTNVHPYVQKVVDLVNAERAKEGLHALTLDTKVSAAAQVRAKECEQSFSHTRPNGSSFSTALKEQNVSYRNAGENIAWGQRTPEVVVNAWMNSPGHRANIMNANFTTIGVGYYQNTNGTNYWCQLFTR